MSARRRRRARRAGLAVAAAVAVLLVGIAGVVLALTRSHPAPPAAQRCVAELDGTSWSLSPDQAQNAALIAATGVHRGLPARAVTIALATALQESKLVNVTYGDRDSLGLFQQRPSQGWGTEEQVQDPVYATGKFYDGLVTVDGYETLPVTEAAQAVQRSGFPDAYAQHETRSRAWASALTGWSPATLTCRLHAPDPAAASPDAVVARVQRDLGAVPVVADDAGGLVVDTSAFGAAQDRARLDWAVAQWAVSVAEPLQLTSVTVADRTWDRAAGAWETTDAAVPAGAVRLTVAGQQAG
ncbi:hypothetical protein [Cellulomonas fengjieae]|uniref:Cobalt transporter n=1 Tax=Cellulomonas fengjieae TaxID=2819978 RepID=A0ABS3SNA9_9CELL|nr:hypothetical protein [Cellulomonas fengjieae]MBO3086450.1 hypothetical protein [Cellulomonas fengjieae]MBO3100445.1 hypothetical protein [Cellulomonas fengjieae]QVI66686.1 hypothetical protein KG102_03545 [Cellulomonas fengjieae]